MENIVDIKAGFTGCNIKAGKVVMQFELDGDYRDTLPQLAMMTGQMVRMHVISDQMVLFVDRDTGEVGDVA